ncbi:hypothetical protein BDV59DRAFT_199682 [Aspergillus ambiguus]|uniref:uncharacterized protein n=1 Tax=Aspergillus ambiguus TaxID=176160 RepID=UPI003CCD115A
MSPQPESSQAKKRESRAGTRKVTSLSAEQLERKRANDREAQRTIRQRTKEHIERLEHQVAELKSKGEQYDDIMRRNAVLENEIRALRQQLSMLGGRQGYGNMAETSYNTTPSGPILSGSQFPEPIPLHPASRAPSALSNSSQVSVAPDWPPYSSTRSSSMCDSSDADYSSGRVEPYVFDGQIRPQNSISLATPQVPFNAPGSASAHAHEQPPFQPYTQLYTPTGSGQAPGEPLHHPQAMSFVPIPRSTSVPTVPSPSDREPRGYPVLPNNPQYQPPQGQAPRTEYSYDWIPR